MSTKKRGHFPLSAEAAPAAAAIVAARAGTLDRRLASLLRQRSGPKSTRAVHEVRVATRRTSVALLAFESLATEKVHRAVRKALRQIRKVCGDSRDADVLLAWLKDESKRASANDSAALHYLASRLKKQRKAGMQAIADSLPKLRSKTSHRIERFIAAMERERTPHEPLSAVMGRSMQQFADAVLEASAADLDDVDCLHSLRIACKRLRYIVELYGPSLGRQRVSGVLHALEEFQERIGGFTDASMRFAFITRELAQLSQRSKSVTRRGSTTSDPPTAALKRLLQRESRTLKREQRSSIQAWRTLETGPLFDDLRRLAFAPHLEIPQLPPPRPASASSQLDAAATTIRAGSNGQNKPQERGRGKSSGKRRLAAIDIGTNSIRLIVAEASADGAYRVLDDEKEITRLGRGLNATGQLEMATQEHSAITIARMKSIAEGYGAQEIRVVGTAACREATNASDFQQLVREHAGLEIEIIPPEQEALLAYRSAAQAFDLRGVPAAVVDIGGGSLEVVFSAGSGHEDPRGAGLGGGVIERVFSLPLGAVRLTEQFGGPERASGKRFSELLKTIRSKLRKVMGKLPLQPQIVVGTGGTFTTLATILAQKELGPAAAGLFSGAVQGREVRRAEISHLLEFLGKLSLKDRAKVPGLPADRADIIVAGLAVIDELLAYLNANSVFVHEGGIRDGLLRSMVQPHCSENARRTGSPLQGVRRLAKACNYEAAHSDHVTKLALRLFDQLSPKGQPAHSSEVDVGTGFDARDRQLLEAAGILHDIGYLVNYASHHKHSYHLIVHAELPGFTSREVQVIANVARYHRGAEPKVAHRNFAALSEQDRRRVRALAAILRIADGLDRTHMQQVDDVTVRARTHSVHIDVLGSQEPGVDIWGAVRKSRLFERVFDAKLHLEWRASTATDLPKSPAKSP